MKIEINRVLGVLAILADLFLGQTGCINGVVDLDGDWDHSGKVEAAAGFSENLSVTTQTSLEMVGANGTIRVTGVAGGQALTVSGTRRVRSDSRQDAERALYDLHVVVEDHTGGFQIETIQPDDSHGRTYIVDYEVTLPSDLHVSILNGNGTVWVKGIQNDVAVANGNGDVILTDLGGSSWVALGNGDLSSTLDLPYGGELAHAVGNGNIFLSVQDQVSAWFDAEVGNGTISVTGLDLNQVTSAPGQLKGILGSGAGAIDLTVGNGQIRVQGR